MTNERDGDAIDSMIDAMRTMPPYDAIAERERRKLVEACESKIEDARVAAGDGPSRQPEMLAWGGVSIADDDPMSDAIDRSVRAETALAAGECPMHGAECPPQIADIEKALRDAGVIDTLMRWAADKIAAEVKRQFDAELETVVPLPRPIAVRPRAVEVPCDPRVVNLVTVAKAVTELSVPASSLDSKVIVEATSGPDGLLQVSAKREAQPNPDLPPAWTREAPKEPGFYWLMSGLDDESLHVVEVCETDGRGLSMEWNDAVPWINPSDLPEFYDARWWPVKLEPPK